MRRSHGPVRSSEPGNKRPVRLLRSRSDPACSGARLTGSQSATRSARGYSAAQHDGREAARRPKHRPLPAPIGDRPERQNHRDNARAVRRRKAPHRSHRFPWAIPSAQKASPPTSRATERATPEPLFPDTAPPCRQRRKSSSRYLGSGHIWSSTISSSLSMRRRISSKHDATVSW